MDAHAATRRALKRNQAQLKGFLKPDDLPTWQAIASYANSGDMLALREAFLESCSRIGIFHDPEEGGAIVGLLATITEESALKDHPEFRSALTWLCALDRRPDLAERSLRFLQSQSDGIRWSLKVAMRRGSRPETVDKTGKVRPPIRLLPEVEVCRSIMSPICRFLIDRIWEYQQGKLDLQEAIRIGVCEREDCDKFRCAERKGRKRFCSDQCRALAFQRSRDDWNEYMRKYRKIKRQMKARQKKKKK